MGGNAQLRVIKPGSVPAAVLGTHPLAKSTGKESGIGRGIVRDFYCKLFAHDTGASLMEAKLHLDNWDGK